MWRLWWDGVGDHDLLRGEGSSQVHSGGRTTIHEGNVINRLKFLQQVESLKCHRPDI